MATMLVTTQGYEVGNSYTSLKSAHGKSSLQTSESLPGSAVTIQDSSPSATTHSFMWKLRALQPATTHSFMWKLRALQPAATHSATSTKHLRTAIGSEESRRKQTCKVTFSQ